MKKFFACCLAVAMLFSCNLVAFAAEADTETEVMVVSEDAAVPYNTTYLYESGVAYTGYVHFNFTVPSTGDVTMIYGCRGGGEAVMVVNHLETGNTVYNTTFDANGSPLAKTKRLSAGSYEVYISCNHNTIYSLNFYRYG